jgi:hypothetical protein
MGRKDHEILSWMRAFAQGLRENWSAYGLSISDAEAISRAVDAFDVAYRRAINPLTRSSITVGIKDRARYSAEQICQQYYSLLKPNAGISTENKAAIGVRQLNRQRTRVQVPLTLPVLSIAGALQGSHTLRYSDSVITGRGKPFGAMFVEIRTAIADEKVFDVSLARPSGLFTKNPIGIEFDPADDRKKATHFGRWVSRRGDVGPWSMPVCMTIAA